MLEIVENKKPVKIGSDEYKLTEPSFAMARRLMEADEEEKLDLTKDLLVDCGLPSEVIDKLSAANVVKIVQYLNGTKKN